MNIINKMKSKIKIILKDYGISLKLDFNYIFRINTNFKYKLYGLIYIFLFGYLIFTNNEINNFN